MNKSENTNELFTALAKSQSEMKGALKDSQNPFFKSDYANLESVWSACREALTKNGLCVIQTTDLTESGLVIKTVLGHSSGQWISGSLPVNPVKSDPQGLGSAISYMRRYALTAMVGVYQTDDDAEDAMNRNGKPQKEAQKTPTPKDCKHPTKLKNRFPEEWPEEKRGFYCKDCKAKFPANQPLN